MSAQSNWTISMDDDHDAFARRLRALSGGALSPIKHSARAANLATQSVKSSSFKVDRLCELLDAASSALGIQPLSPAGMKRRGRSSPPLRGLGKKGVSFSDARGNGGPALLTSSLPLTSSTAVEVPVAKPLALPVSKSSVQLLPPAPKETASSTVLAHSILWFESWSVVASQLCMLVR